MKKILFVCTGNTCRSCMAEAIFNDIISKDNELKGYLGTSVGLAAFDGQKASNGSIKALKELFGISLENHKAKSISREAASDAWLILTMTEQHKQAINYLFNEFRLKTFTLKGYINNCKKNDEKCYNVKELNINDPYGSDENTYKICAQEISRAILDLVLKLKSQQIND